MQVLYQIMFQTVSSVGFSQLHSDIRTCWSPALLRDLQFSIQETHTARSKSFVWQHKNDLHTLIPGTWDPIVPMVEDKVRLQVGWPTGGYPGQMAPMSCQGGLSVEDMLEQCQQKDSGSP